MDARASDGASSDLETQVLDLIAEMTGIERGELQKPSQLVAARIDSLTSIAIVTRIEAVFGIAAEESVFELLVAGEFGQLGRLVARIVADQTAKLGKTAGNESCEPTGRALQCD